MPTVATKNRVLKHIEDAAKARSDLNIFYGVIAILEKGKS